VSAEADKIRESLASLLEYTEQAVEFSKDQAPLVAQEIIHWGIASNAAWVLAWVAAIVALSFVFRAGRRAHAKNDLSMGDLVMFLSVLAIGGCSLGVMSSLGGFIKAVVAPRLYLIEYIGRLLS